MFKLNAAARIQMVKAANEAATKKQKVYKAEVLKILKYFESLNPAMKVEQHKRMFGGRVPMDVIEIRISQDPSLITRFEFVSLKDRDPAYANPAPNVQTIYLNQHGTIIHHDTADYGLGWLRNLQDIRNLKKTFPQYAEKIIERHKQGGFQYGHD